MRNLVLAAIAILLLGATQALAQPTLGADCPTGTTLVGSDKAGRIALGPGPAYACTLEGLPNHDRACSAMNETNGGGHPIAIGAVPLSSTSVLIDSFSPIADGDTLSYQCSTF